MGRIKEDLLMFKGKRLKKRRVRQLVELTVVIQNKERKSQVLIVD